MAASPSPEMPSPEMNDAEFANITALEEGMWWFRGQRQILNRLLDPLAGGYSQVLEAGCGTGYQAREFTRRYGWRVTALDLSAEGLRQGQRLGVERLVQGDLQSLPFGAESFDAVLSLDVIVHFPPGEEPRAFAELARVLRPGGLFVVRVSALNVLHSRHSVFTHEKQRFTAGHLRRCASDAGIDALRVTYANSLLLPVALFKFRVWEPLTQAPPASGVAPMPGWLDGLLGSALSLEASLIGTGLNLPLGQSVLLLGRKGE
ncbi:MAG: class I SAM-dependent methyltransferase [Bryobacteraceae bacterium]|nr:class I SAM-dependent methyltransferase [Bryobacteraceae bacterium]